MPILFTNSHMMWWWIKASDQWVAFFSHKLVSSIKFIPRMMKKKARLRGAGSFCTSWFVTASVVSLQLSWCLIYVSSSSLCKSEQDRRIQKQAWAMWLCSCSCSYVTHVMSERQDIWARGSYTQIVCYFYRSLLRHMIWWWIKTSDQWVAFFLFSQTNIVNQNHPQNDEENSRA